MKGLYGLGKPFKYVVSCVIAQKNGAGLHSALSSHWDPLCDGLLTVKWPADKSKDPSRTMQCLVTVAGFSM
jgi:dynein light chain Tctex-type 1